jgi:hypothetical protein
MANNTKVIQPSPSPLVPLIDPTNGTFTHGEKEAKTPSPDAIRIAFLCLFIFLFLSSYSFGFSDSAPFF